MAHCPKQFFLIVLATPFFLSPLDTATAYQLGQRWTRTATDGSGLTQGDATTITWSIVPDGTFIPGEGPSDLISKFDTAFNETNAGSADLTNRVWWQKMNETFLRWEQLGGNTYMYEPFDDGVDHGGQVGFLGVRGDVRIGGQFIDGNSNVLAYNAFPNNGDMMIDTGDTAFYSNPNQNYRRLRNTVGHEHGHGMGLNHVVSNNARFLMEPFIDTGFSGPQLDDIRGYHRGYGDVYEKNGGNDTAGTATDIGSFNDGDSFKVGRDGRTLLVNQFETDFISIDDNNDFDFFTFNLPANSDITIDLTPVGPTYLQGPQGGSQNSVNSSAVSDLTLALIDTDQSTLLATSNVGGLGIAEQIAGFSLSAGQYYIRATGTANISQLYELELNVASFTINGDFNNDGFWDGTDIDALAAVAAAGSNDPDFDLDGDGSVNILDIESWLAEGGAMNPAQTNGNPFLTGDANLDGVTDGQDFILWNARKFTETTDWTTGNFNGDAVTDGLDFILWNTFKFMSSSDSFAAVPEPSTACLLMVVLGCIGRCRRRA